MSAELLAIPGIGPQTLKQLERLEIHSIFDLLMHLPRRYQDKTRVQYICDAVLQTEILIAGEITQCSQPSGRGRSRLVCEMDDGTGRLTLRFFHAPTFLIKKFKVGNRLRVFGTIKLGPTGREMLHPEIQFSPTKAPEYFSAIYPTTQGLSQYTLRKICHAALVAIEKKPEYHSLLPTEILQAHNLLEFQQALKYLHQPPLTADLDQLAQFETPAQHALIIEELLAHRAALLNLKSAMQTTNAAPLAPHAEIFQQFMAQLPFELTAAQARVQQAIQADLMRDVPMLRLVQGDVGSGKTVIAALAMLQACVNQYQCVLMAPTELLAEQHAKTISNWFQTLDVNVVLLTGNIKGAARKKILEDLLTGKINALIGTHAVFQEAVQFKNLALIIIDEQHRFGVEQRSALRNKSNVLQPHQLMLTATPIPRTLAMSLFADLDCSVIDELPPGRTPIYTSVIANSKRAEIIQRIRDACHEGKQAYWVCPLIEESETLDVEDVISIRSELAAAMPQVHIDIIHGRMKQAEKDAAMRDFKEHRTQLLVATTVIEVGVDVPNASIMVIENAERLGLSQLHQLRGRVGRGKIASHCLLLYQAPLSQHAQERLQVMRTSTDGFFIAERDLQLRGAGEILGTKQTGAVEFRVADLMRDSRLVASVTTIADEISKNHASAATNLIARWSKNLIEGLS